MFPNKKSQEISATKTKNAGLLHFLRNSTTFITIELKEQTTDTV